MCTYASLVSVGRTPPRMPAGSVKSGGILHRYIQPFLYFKGFHAVTAQVCRSQLFTNPLFTNSLFTISLFTIRRFSWHNPLPV